MGHYFLDTQYVMMAGRWQGHVAVVNSLIAKGENVDAATNVSRPSDYCTVCPRTSCPFYVVTYYIKWVTTSWTHSMLRMKSIDRTVFTQLHQ